MVRQVSQKPCRTVFVVPIAVALMAALAIGCGSGGDQTAQPLPGRDWPMFGHDLRHSFAAVRSPID
jgi:hypothetical protein